MKTQLLALSFGRQLSSLKSNFLSLMFRESFEAMKRYLTDTGQVELGKTPCRLGRMLTFDAEAERFVEAPDANQLLTHSYRDAFVVPERA